MRTGTPLALCLLLLACVPLLAQPKYRGYTVMAGGLGRPPAGPKDMWRNTVQNHLEFIKKAKINLVVVEVPYGVSKRHPKSSQAASFIKKLRSMQVEVWIIYPHVLAQTFDLPRQVGSDGKVVSWNCCFNHPEVQDWLIENGRRVVDTYRPDGLVLFGTFHKGAGCFCDHCKGGKGGKGGKEGKEGKVRRTIKPSTNMENFFLRWSKAVRKAAPRIKLGTCNFWAKATRKTLDSIDVVCPVVPIFQPGYAKAGQVKRKAGTWRSSYRGKPIVVYVKIFLASQTKSATEHILAAAQEGVKHCDGFFYWGYNPRHSYQNQDYDHDLIQKKLEAMAGKRRSRAKK